jgi:DNA-nicking Smr family endonuclease
MPRRLHPEEAAVWGRVAGTVRRLNPPRNGEGDRLEVVEGAVASKLKRHNSIALIPAPPTLRATSPFRGGLPSANTLDANWDKRLAKGMVAPDWTIDLHGHSLSSAHSLLDRALGQAILHGARMILLVTGKPARENPRLPPTSRGVIRASIADWLASSGHAGKIAAVRNAHPRHGGAGALYVILKRMR